MCSQRVLDTTFKGFTRDATFYSYYFGTVDGTFRHYPGVVSNIPFFGGLLLDMCALGQG